MKFGSCAIGIYESGQGRNAAAIRRTSYVPQGCLAELTARVTYISSLLCRIFMSIVKNIVTTQNPICKLLLHSFSFVHVVTSPYKYSRICPFLQSGCSFHWTFVWLWIDKIFWNKISQVNPAIYIEVKLILAIRFNCCDSRGNRWNHCHNNGKKNDQKSAAQK